MTSFSCNNPIFVVFIVSKILLDNLFWLFQSLLHTICWTPLRINTFNKKQSIYFLNSTGEKQKSYLNQNRFMSIMYHSFLLYLFFRLFNNNLLKFKIFYLKILSYLSLLISNHYNFLVLKIIYCNQVLDLDFILFIN